MSANAALKQFNKKVDQERPDKVDYLFKAKKGILRERSGRDFIYEG